MLDTITNATHPITNTAPLADLPLNLVEAQKRGTKFFADVNELTTRALRSILESQTELLRLETHQAAQTFFLPKVGDDPAATGCAYFDRVHEQTERVIAQARQVNDIIRDYGWNLLTLYSQNYGKAVSAAQSTTKPQAS